MDLGPLVGTYDSALSSIVKMKRADVNSKNFPPFRRGKKKVPSPYLSALLDPSCQETIPSACSDKLIPENVFFFFPPLPFPSPAIMSFPFLTHSHPSFLPPYKPRVMNGVLKIKTWMHDSSSLPLCHHLSCTDFQKMDKALHIFFSWFFPALKKIIFWMYLSDRYY